MQDSRGRAVGEVRLWVLVATPSHAALGSLLCYSWSVALPPGTLVRVPLGRRETLGLVWDAPAAGAAQAAETPSLRPLVGVVAGIAPLGGHWRSLVAFTAHYYQRSLGEVALAALPPPLRASSLEQLERRAGRAAKASAKAQAGSVGAGGEGGRPTERPELTPEQQQVLADIDHGPGPFLLFGATGSGKTEVYLRCVEALLERDAGAQALVLVPEINLTPQLEVRFRQRFGALLGDGACVSLHSGLTPVQRLQAWLAAHQGRARIVLGTRMAVLASLPNLGLIVVDEEHDPSFKAADGARHSARDLAVYRARLQAARVILGSATPALESWYHSRPEAEGGRYQRLRMPLRVGQTQASALRVRRVDMQQQPKGTVIAPALLAALAERVARGEQSMLLLNRRGYAPALHCAACGWKSQCAHCSAFRVFHKADRTLRCHHCGFAERVPRACPDCGNLDIEAVGRGTERLEEVLGQLLADVRRPAAPGQTEGGPVRIARIDADSTRTKGSLESQLGAVHDGDVDIVVGTQMIAKGHDFRRMTLVAAVNPDSALFSSDFRAAERLFALLLQAGGRAGRDAQLGAQAELWIQTYVPDHPLFQALVRQDYEGFARQQLEQRAQAQLPPFMHQALVRCEAHSQESAQQFLNAARAAVEVHPDWQSVLAAVQIYPAVPMTMARVADVERAQMLIESASRVALQRFLSAWHPVLHDLRRSDAGQGVVRWAIDVDPQAI